MSAGRGAPRVVATSDVTRFRGVAVAAIVAAAVAVIVVLVRAPTLGRGAPGPLSAGHRAAGVGCASCHTAGTAASAPATACVTCHGPHASMRDGHAAARTRGELTCTGCHGGHRGHGSVTLFPDGRARRDDALGARELALGGFRPPRPVTIALVEARACQRCHAPASPPMASCVVDGVAVCFDEHVMVRGADGAILGKDVAWEAAREVVRVLPARRGGLQRTGAAGGPWWWIGVAGMAGVVAVAAARRRRRSPPPPATTTTTSTTTGMARVKRLPVIDTTTCLGCDACVEACPYDVLEVKRYVAVVARPDACCGLTLCAQVCPNQSLTMRDHGDVTPGIERHELEAAGSKGVFVVGDAGGGSLIRNAVDEGARAVATIAARVKGPRDADTYDVLIIGAGPAGLAAALEARARGLRALTLEQGTVAGSIQSFPRGKLVLDHAAHGAAPPRLWLAEATKEELLARWMLAVRTERPPIEEGRRVTALTPAGDGTWHADAVDVRGATLRHHARAVVLAVGRRGSPRRLDVEIPAAMRAHVHYALADAASFAGRQVVVVGLGDVAMETAIALSRQPGTTVVMAYRGTDFRRGRARNVDELRRRIAAGAVRLHWQSEVAALRPGRAVLQTPTGRVDEPCDAVFVLIGAEPGSDLVTRLTRPVPPAQTDAAIHASDPVGSVQHPGDRGEEAPP